MKTIPITASIISSLLISSISTAQSGLKFDKIRVSGPASVELRQGEEAGIIIEDLGSSQNLSNYVNTTEDGWLVITGSHNDIIVTATTLAKIDISGSGKLETEGVFKTEDIELKVTGAGKMEMDLIATKVKCVISGSGKIELEGSADEMKVDISGSGKIDAEQFKVKSCTANISGSGKCLVDVTDELTANISGSGSVYYITKPTILNNNISGVGRVGDATTAVNDTTRIMFGKTKILIVDGDGTSVKLGFKDTTCCDEKVKSHWAGFEMGVNLLMNDEFSNTAPEGYDFLDQRPEKSIALNFNVADYEIDLYRKNIMLVTGIGFSVQNYRFNSDAYLAPDSSNVTSIGDPSFTLSKNKLVTGYINVPLLVEFNTSENPKKTFHIAVGVIGGVRVHTHLKLIEDSGENEVKHKIFDDFNVNPWRADATVRLGYRNFTVFGSYGLTHFFRDNKEPELHALTMGVRLVGW